MGYKPEIRDDIRIVTDEIARLQYIVSGSQPDAVHDWQKELSIFVERYGPLVISLLDELLYFRETSTSGGIGFKNTFRTVLEGYSDRSATEALSLALEKAACLFSEHHDISVTLQALTALPQGGHRAVVEVHISPLTLRHHPHPQGPDVELKRIHDHEYDQARKHEEEQIKHLVFDHVVSAAGGSLPDIPNYFLININDSYLLNHLIEKEFIKSSHISPALPDEFSAPAPQQILVRTNRSKRPYPSPEPD
ncbi:MAG: hypothetical protein HYS17_07595 [Micavibrio aeruginosavorus]|uniref:Uncharacterized protein n=1 Tax=Micavibrio aeruginosavorus TaxID=349221 RepID=A0A7T5UFP2_9BACT|nr:MAG: hypothetical protein HYS17_07595 [Micavibrio aeruginosavorus]